MQINSYVVAALLLLATACRESRNAVAPNGKTNPQPSDGVDRNEQNSDNTEAIFRADFDTIEAEPVPVPVKTVKESFDGAFIEIQRMLEGRQRLDFKRAVFVSENAYFNDSLNYAAFERDIDFLKGLTDHIYSKISMANYPYADSLKLKKNYALFVLLKDTIYKDSNVFFSKPIQYDFNDFLGIKNWSSTFVTKLVYTGVGNCHSMPYLYKILANEINTEAYLALAPNHIYIKNRNKRLGWYNTELPSGQFPTDAWVKASGYITLEAIRNGIYMDTLSQFQSVALCAYDLGKNYFAKTKNESDGFIIKCCDLTLKYHPQNINAIILKAETLKKVYENLLKKGNQTEAQAVFKEMQDLYVRGLNLGYREMPIEMYQAWLISLKTEQKNVLDNEINSNFKKNGK